MIYKTREQNGAILTGTANIQGSELEQVILIMLPQYRYFPLRLNDTLSKLDAHDGGRDDDCFIHILGNTIGKLLRYLPVIYLRTGDTILENICAP